MGMASGLQSPTLLQNKSERTPVSGFLKAVLYARARLQSHLLFEHYKKKLIETRIKQRGIN